MPSRPSISAAPRNSGTRNTRILAIAVSNSASSNAADGELGDIGGEPDERMRRRPRAGGARPQGTKMQAISEM